MSEDREKLTKGEFRQEVRDLIDVFFQSGGEVEDAEEVLEHHAEGVEYYLEDLQRTMRKQQEQARQAEDFDPEEIEEDNVEPVDE